MEAGAGKVLRAAIAALITLMAASVLPATASAFPQGPWGPPKEVGKPVVRDLDLSESESGGWFMVWSDAESANLGTSPDSTFRDPTYSVAIPSATNSRTQVEVNRTGLAAAAWVVNDGSVWVVVRRPGGVWGTPKQIDAPVPSGTDRTAVALSVSEDGTVALGWERPFGGRYRATFAASRDGGVNFSAPASLSSPEDDTWDLAVEAASGGMVVAAWSESDGNAYYSFMRPGKGEFAPAADLGSGGDIRLASRGSRVSALWDHAYTGDPYHQEPAAYAATSRGGEAFTNGESLGKNVRPGALGVAGGGATFVATHELGPVEDTSTLRLSRMSVSGEIAWTKRISSPSPHSGRQTRGPAMSVDATGTVNLLWTLGTEEGVKEFFSITRHRDRGFGPITHLDTASIGPYDVAHNSEGEALSVWTRTYGGKYWPPTMRLYAAVAAPDNGYCVRSGLELYSARLNRKRNSVTVTGGATSYGPVKILRSSRTKQRLVRPDENGEFEIKLPLRKRVGKKGPARLQDVRIKAYLNPGFGCAPLRTAIRVGVIRIA